MWEVSWSPPDRDEVYLTVTQPPEPRIQVTLTKKQFDKFVELRLTHRPMEALLLVLPPVWDYTKKPVSE